MLVSDSTDSDVIVWLYIGKFTRICKCLAERKINFDYDRYFDLLDSEERCGESEVQHNKHACQQYAECKMGWRKKIQKIDWKFTSIVDEKQFKAQTRIYT